MLPCNSVAPLGHILKESLAKVSSRKRKKDLEICKLTLLTQFPTVKYQYISGKFWDIITLYTSYT